MKQLIKLLAVAIVVGLTLTGCMKEYTITVESNNTDWGTTEGSGVYMEGTSVKISAFPKSGYYFIKWDDNVTDNPRTIQVTGNATYTAYFSNDPNGGDTNSTDPLTMSGTISSNVTWADRGLSVDYIIEGNLTIDGNALLTIDPGVTIMFTGTNGGIYVGENAGLRMVGTPDNPIVLQGPTNNPNNGSWKCVNVTSNRSDNQFEYVRFVRGGSLTGDGDGVVYVTGKLSMKHCTVDGSLSNGVACSEGAFSAFEDNIVKNCAGYPLYSETPISICKGLGSGNSFTNCAGGNVVFVAFASLPMTENLTLANIVFPYRMRDGLFLEGNKSFTVEAGVVVEMAANKDIYIDDNTFVANGTSDSPIIFRCAESGEHWNGINITNNKNNSLSYCQIQNCGTDDVHGDRQCLRIHNGAKVSLTNNTFGPSAYYGISIDYIGDMSNVTHSGNSYTGCAAGNVLVEGGGFYGGQEYEDGDVLDDLP